MCLGGGGGGGEGRSQDLERQCVPWGGKHACKRLLVKGVRIMRAKWSSRRESWHQRQGHLKEGIYTSRVSMRREPRERKSIPSRSKVGSTSAHICICLWRVRGLLPRKGKDLRHGYMKRGTCISLTDGRTGIDLLVVVNEVRTSSENMNGN